jgi:hypothetical protein
MYRLDGGEHGFERRRSSFAQPMVVSMAVLRLEAR